MNEAWRKFNAYQVEYCNEYVNSKLKLKGAIEMFNIRPPELLIFHNILFFSKYLKASHYEKKESKTCENTQDSDLIDTLGNVYKFYSCILKDALNFLNQ